MAEQSGAVFTNPGSASTAWFTTKEAADGFSESYYERTGKLLGVVDAANFSLIYHT